MKRDALIGVVLAAIVLATFGQVVGFDFINYDDPDYVTANPYVRAGLTRAGLAWALTTSHASNWHPVTWLSHMLDCEVWGLRPGGHHLTSVVLHAGSSLLLFAVLRGMTASVWPSAAVAWLFALHPLHVESVAWVAERKDVLSTFFWMLTVLAYWRYVRRPGIARYLLVMLLLALGLMAKPMLVSVPFVLLLLDVWPLGRLSPSVGAGASSGRALRPVLEKIPLLCVVAASSLVTLAVGLRGGAMAAFDTLPLSSRLGNATVSSVLYLRKTVLPVDLGLFYPRASFSGGQVAGAALIVIVVSATVLRLGRERPWLIVGWLWYLVTLLPVIGLVQVGDQAMADRYTYVPLIGPFIMVAWSVKDVMARWPAARAPVGIIAMGLLAICPAITWLQLRHWRSSVTLFTHAAAVIPDNYVAQVQLGNALAEQGRFAEAIDRYRAALRVKPDLAEAHGNLGALLAQEGRLDEAIAEYAEALRLNPNLADAHNNLGVALAAQGQVELAIRHYAEALRLNPNHQTARDNLARALAARGGGAGGDPQAMQ
jgi:hypothetical protein